MKIVYGEQTKPPRNERFKNGHLYQHRTLPRDSVLYLYSCGYLMELPECKTMHNIICSGFEPNEYVDVTDRFELREVTENNEACVYLP